MDIVAVGCGVFIVVAGTHNTRVVASKFLLKICIDFSSDTFLRVIVVKSNFGDFNSFFYHQRVETITF